MHVAIIHSASGRGLARDAELLRQTVSELGHSVTVVTTQPQKPLWRELSFKWHRALVKLPLGPLRLRIQHIQRAVRRLANPLPASTNLVIHLENVHPQYIIKNQINWLIPNQEWFRTTRLHYLSDINRVLCKTQTAIAAFAPHHPSVQYLGFSIPNAITARDPVIKSPEKSGFIHISGSSLSKGTAAVLQAWKNHPEWPILSVVANSELVPDELSQNIKHYRNIDDAELEALWKASRIAVIPSEVEGYGQVLVEAMKVGAVLITTDAPPMNELITSERGYLVPYRDSRPFRLGRRFYVTAEDVEAAIQQILDEPSEALEKKAQKAKEWVQENHMAFKERLASQFALIDESVVDSATQATKKSAA
ncbi:MAG: hypothetical protein CMH83_19985 [Nocardioides sp.]|nr:hypothetical protein [Nocardioides sp.]